MDMTNCDHSKLCILNLRVRREGLETCTLKVSVSAASS